MRPGTINEICHQYCFEKDFLTNALANFSKILWSVYRETKFMFWKFERVRNKINKSKSYLKILAINHHTMPGFCCWWQFVDNHSISDTVLIIICLSPSKVEDILETAAWTHHLGAHKDQVASTVCHQRACHWHWWPPSGWRGQRKGFDSTRRAWTGSQTSQKKAENEKST